MLSRTTVRFADFELVLRAAELRSNGKIHHLREKPFQILSILIESPEQLVTRDELRKRL